MNYIPGDVLLVMKQGIIAEGIAWRTGGEFCHSIPIIGMDVGLEVNSRKFSLIKPNEVVAERIVHLRLTKPLTDEESRLFLEQGCHIFEKDRYDIKSWWGWFWGTGEQNHRRPNCAEAVLQCFQRAGRFTTRSEHMLAPQTFMEFTHAGAFYVVSDRRL